MTAPSLGTPAWIRPPGPRARARAARKTRTAGLNALGVLVALLTLFPIFWMVSTAFKPSQEIYSLTPRLLPVPSDAGQLLGRHERPGVRDRPGVAVLPQQPPGHGVHRGAGLG